MLIVADDLTGAADAAGAFAAEGQPGVVIVGGGRASVETANAAVVSVDTHGRSMSETEAAAATVAAIRAHAQRPLFIKIDSTMRGHIRATVVAALSALETLPTRVVVCPAFPALGRTVVDGWVNIDSEPAPDGDLRAALSGFPPNGGLFIPTARSDDELAAVVRSIHNPDCPQDTLWVGSAGLARQLAVHLAGVTTAPVERAAASRIAVVVGSQHQRTLAQLAQLKPDVRVFRIDPSDASYVDQIVPTLRKVDGLVLTGGHTARVVLDGLGVDTLTVGGEVEIGMPWSIASQASVDGEAQRPLAIVTKAGGFGDDMALRDAVAFLAHA